MDRRRSEAGFTFIEIAISSTVLSVALLAVWSTVVYCSRSNVAADQKRRAIDAAEARIEFLKAQDFDTLLEDFGPSGADEFAVPSLDSAAAAEGRILLYSDETNPTGETGLGLPRDLNGDGDALDEDVSADYRLLPVRVRIAWDGVLGPQEVEVRTLLRREEE